MKYCFLDLETTGFDPEKDSIIEISFLIYDENKKEIDRLDHVIIPHKSELTPQITHITGITQEEIDTKGVPFDYLRDQINQKLKGCTIIGHNIQFDINFLIANGIDIQENPYIDTHQLARILLINEESYALEILSKKQGFTHKSAHRAMSDVEANTDLYYFLVDKIEKLPQDYRDIIVPLLKKTPEWGPKKLFLNAQGKETHEPIPHKTPVVNEPQSIDHITPHLSALSTEESLFVQQGQTQKSANTICSLAKKIIENGEQVLIISPKLDYFPSVKKIPTPEVLFDPDRFKTFMDQKEFFNGEEITFILKSAYRHFLGLRGVDFFDLFFKERDFWREICMNDEHNEEFQKILTERKTEDILSISPKAFFRFHDTDLIKNRILLIDESELFAQDLLFFSSDTLSLFPYINSPEKKVNVAAQFWVGNFCKDILEQKLQRTLSQFPEKIILQASDVYKKQAESLAEIGNDETIQKIQILLEEYNPNITRWVQYFPESGNLSFGTWQEQNWKLLKAVLEDFKKIFFYRHKPSQSNAFFRIFTGCKEGRFIDEKDPKPPLEIPSNLVSVKSPHFNSASAQHILDFAKKHVSKNHFLAVNFSSLESLKKVHHELFEKLPEEEYTLLGEKVMGGDGKMIQKLNEAENVIFLEQKIIRPEIGKYPFKTLMIQKLPFNAPHPLLETIENTLKQSNISFWEVWTLPQVTANLSRRISIYPHLKKIVWLDPRHNTRWGKEMMDNALK